MSGCDPLDRPQRLHAAPLGYRREVFAPVLMTSRPLDDGDDDGSPGPGASCVSIDAYSASASPVVPVSHYSVAFALGGDLSGNAPVIVFGPAITYDFKYAAALFQPTGTGELELVDHEDIYEEEFVYGITDWRAFLAEWPELWTANGATFDQFSVARRSSSTGFSLRMFSVSATGIVPRPIWQEPLTGNVAIAGLSNVTLVLNENWISGFAEDPETLRQWIDVYQVSGLGGILVGDNRIEGDYIISRLPGDRDPDTIDVSMHWADRVDDARAVVFCTVRSQRLPAAEWWYDALILVVWFDGGAQQLIRLVSRPEDDDTWIGNGDSHLSTSRGVYIGIAAPVQGIETPAVEYRIDSVLHPARYIPETNLPRRLGPTTIQYTPPPPERNGLTMWEVYGTDHDSEDLLAPEARLFGMTCGNFGPSNDTVLDPEHFLTKEWETGSWIPPLGGFEVEDADLPGGYYTVHATPADIAGNIGGGAGAEAERGEALVIDEFLRVQRIKGKVN